MTREDARNYEFSKIFGLLSLVTIMNINGALSQRVKVDPEVTSYPGQPVNLRCAFSQEAEITRTQVSWIYEPKTGERVNIAVFHPGLGVNYPTSPQNGRVSFIATPPTLDAPSIQILDARMSDEGKYICEFATYPSGNEQGITSLVMLAKPNNSASAVTVLEQSKLVTVARCVSLNGRPPAQITWVTTAHGNATTVSQAGAANTVSVTSEYKMVPTAADNGKDISCVVSHKTQSRPESFPMKLAVEYPPQVSIEGYDNNWYLGRTNVVLTCQATGNPIPTTVVWKTLSGEMPDTVVIKENKLTVLKVDESVNTTFVCEVKNRLGIGKEQITSLVRVTRLPEKGATTGTIIGAIIGVIILLAVIGTAIAMYRKRQSQMHNGDGPPKYKPPPPKKTNSHNNTDVLRTSRDPVSEDRPLQQQYHITKEAEPVTDLDAYHEEEYTEGINGEHRYDGAPSDWDDLGHNEDSPPYAHLANEYQEPPPATGLNRGESFMSPAMFV